MGDQSCFLFGSCKRIEDRPFWSYCQDQASLNLAAEWVVYWQDYLRWSEVLCCICSIETQLSQTRSPRLQKTKCSQIFPHSSTRRSLWKEIGKSMGRLEYLTSLKTAAIRSSARDMIAFWSMKDISISNWVNWKTRICVLGEYETRRLKLYCI